MGDESDVTLMEKRLLDKLTKHFNGTVKQFFNNKDFDEKMECYIHSRMGDMLNQSSQSISVLDQTIPKNDHESRLLALEERDNERVQTIENLLKELQQEKTKNAILTEENDGLKTKAAASEQAYSDKCVASLHALDAVTKDIQRKMEHLKEDAAAAHADITQLKRFEKELDNLKYEVVYKENQKEIGTSLSLSDMNSKIEDLLECRKTIEEMYDNLEQYGRRDILEFWGIYQRDRENTTDLVLDFLESVLGLKLSKYDISVSHRQRQSQSSNAKSRSPDPIYVKFVNRFVKNHILYLKKKLINRMRQTNVYICENLTQTRRGLLALAKSKLKDFKFVWVKEGSIFARKHSKSKVYKITNTDTVTKLSGETK